MCSCTESCKTSSLMSRMTESDGRNDPRTNSFTPKPMNRQVGPEQPLPSIYVGLAMPNTGPVVQTSLDTEDDWSE